MDTVKARERKVIVVVLLTTLLVSVFLWWLVFIQTAGQWWQFDVGERIEAPESLGRILEK